MIFSSPLSTEASAPKLPHAKDSAQDAQKSIVRLVKCVEPSRGLPRVAWPGELSGDLDAREHLNFFSPPLHVPLS